MRIVTLATGVGNVRSVLRAVERVTANSEQVEISATADSDAVRRADVLIAPGQGSFGAFAEALDGGLRGAIVDHIRSGRPYLGICLGLQILFEESEEAPGAKGLGVFRGRVRRLTPGVDEQGRPLALPHVGWNQATAVDGRIATAEPIVEPAHYYFAHTYAVAPDEGDVTLTTTTYGADTFASAARRDNVVGVQFHPEKSQSKGLQVIERFFSQLCSPKVG